jgi:hypothetical protein
MAGQPCAMALLSSMAGKANHHTQTDLHVLLRTSTGAKCRDAGYTRGGQMQETARPRERSNTPGPGVRGAVAVGDRGSMYGTTAVIWLRGLVLCRQITDRVLPFAATKSASRSLRAYILNIIHHIALPPTS